MASRIGRTARPHSLLKRRNTMRAPKRSSPGLEPRGAFFLTAEASIVASIDPIVARLGEAVRDHDVL